MGIGGLLSCSDLELRIESRISPRRKEARPEK